MHGRKQTAKKKMKESGKGQVNTLFVCECLSRGTCVAQNVRFTFAGDKKKTNVPTNLKHAAAKICPLNVSEFLQRLEYGMIMCVREERACIRGGIK